MKRPVRLFDFPESDPEGAVRRYREETSDPEALDLLWPFTTLIVVVALLGLAGAWAIARLVRGFS